MIHKITLLAFVMTGMPGTTVVCADSDGMTAGGLQGRCFHALKGGVASMTELSQTELADIEGGDGAIVSNPSDPLFQFLTPSLVEKTQSGPGDFIISGDARP